MKPFDLYHHFHKFCEMLDNEALPFEVRKDMAREWIRSLPVPMLCQPYELSRKIIEQTMQGRLQEKELEHGGVARQTSKQEEELQRALPVQQPTGTGAQPIRKNAANGRGKTAVETVDRQKTPKAKRQRAGKA